MREASLLLQDCRDTALHESLAECPCFLIHHRTDQLARKEIATLRLRFFCMLVLTQPSTAQELLQRLYACLLILKFQFIGQHLAAGGVGSQGSYAISQRETQALQAPVACFMQGIEAQPATHGIDGPFHVSCSFVEPGQGTKELVHAQVPVLALLARPIVEKLRVAQREVCQERAAHQACGLLELRLQFSIHLVGEECSWAPYLLADSFNEAKVQQEWAVLIESKRIALSQQVRLLAWTVRALKELTQLEEGST
jgi:hypothetical protein